MAKDLKLDLKDKNILYPKEIKQAHDILLDQYEKYKDKITDKSIKRRAKKLQKYIYEDNEFIIFPAENYESLIDESSQQKNCVRTYAERIANGECDIYFMRYKKTKEKSLVTIEVQKHKVVQKRTKNNEKTTKKQDRFLKKWEEKILIN